MKNPFQKFHIGLRTLKTTIAVILSMVVIDILGTTDSKLIFAMVGAMSAVQPTFKESVEAFLSQIIGVVFGALCSILLCALPLPSLVAVGIGIVLVITLYNGLRIRYSPSLPCFILVLVCTTADVEPVAYAVGRIWDTAIGLTIGMLINMLVFPYDNSQQIRATAYSLDKELLAFLENLFDGDDVLPDLKTMRKTIATLERQLALFSNQKLLLNPRRQSQELETFQACEEKAQALISHMEVLCSLGAPGSLNEENKQYLAANGTEVCAQPPMDPRREQDVVTNYHIGRILNLRQELLDVLDK